MSRKHTAIAVAAIISFTAQFAAIAFNADTAFAQRAPVTKSTKTQAAAPADVRAPTARGAAYTGIRAPRATTVALTATECTNLNGVVGDASGQCPLTNKACTTVGPDQVIRIVCITEAG